MSFAHLHVHSEFSLLDGMGRIDELISAAEQMGQPALALTDHGTMSGLIQFYDRAKASSVKPILGCEVYICADRHEKGSYNHLTLLAENETGYRNLIQLSTRGYTEGFYYKPRVDFDLLSRHSEGLICLSGCMASELSQEILNDGSSTGDIVTRFIDAFGDRYYLEIQDHGLPDDRRLIGSTIELARRYGVPLVATNDAHYVRQDQAPVHEILLCIQTRDVMSNPPGHHKGGRFSLGPQEFYLKSRDEMERLFGDYPEALSNTLEIAERCNVTLDFGRPHLPKFETPLETPKYHYSSAQYLHDLVMEGLMQRYPDTWRNEPMDRAIYELKIIEQAGYADYFLIVWDVIRYARERNIPVGPGRGSGAGSIVAYALFVTGVDPLAYGLSFERFLNPERVSMPDMDLDFADDRRGEVVEYVTRKYGSEHVAGIITIGTIGVRAGIRDVSRVLEKPLEWADELSKMVPSVPAPKTVEFALNQSPELQDAYEGDKDAKEVLDLVREITGIARHSGQHPAGVVISKDPLIQHVPLAKNKGEIVTQYDMASIDKLGLLKMDFLGLRTLSIIAKCLVFLRERDIHLQMEKLPVEHPSIFKLLSSGNTFGVFQVDGYGMRKLLKELKPTEFRHIVAIEALYRPGPMQYIDQFVDRRHGIEDPEYRHPVMEEVLKDTYGIIVYQEQVMQLAVKLAGYTMGEADLLRKAMGKKKPEEMAKQQSVFIGRCVERGIERAVAEAIFHDIEPFAGYAFNRAHSTSYAFLTAWTAYLKATYPTEFMAAVLSCESSNTEKLRAAVVETRRLKIPLLNPDINQSNVDFRPVEGGIRFGLASIPNIGGGACDTIVAEREKGVFLSPWDFCARLPGTVVNKRVFEALIQCGAMDTLMERNVLLDRLEQIMAFGQALYKARAAGQESLWGDEIVVELEPEVSCRASDRRVTFDLERSGDKHTDIARAVRAMQIAQRYPGPDDFEVVLGGINVPVPLRTGYCDAMEQELLELGQA